MKDDMKEYHETADIQNLLRSFCKVRTKFPSSISFPYQDSYCRSLLCSGKPKRILFKINHFVGIMPYYWRVWTYNRNLKTEKSPTMSSDWHQCPGCVLKMRHVLLVKATILKLSLSLLMNLDTIWGWNTMVGKIWTSAILMGTWWVRHWAVAKIPGQFAAKDTLRNFLRE